MIIYNVFIPFYPKKINKNTLWSLNFSKIWAEVPHTSLTGCFGSVNQLILLKIKHLTLNKNHNPAKLSDLVGHLGTHIRNDESLICPHEKCNRTYQCVFILRLVDSCQRKRFQT
jgi:hypothetical protein